jgi:hypothetical protein
MQIFLSNGTFNLFSILDTLLKAGYSKQFLISMGKGGKLSTEDSGNF